VDGRDAVYPIDVGVYIYRIGDGREFTTLDGTPVGELRERLQVEYLPDKPAVSRIKGDGCQAVTEWLWRKVCPWALLLLLLCSPGVCL